MIARVVEVLGDLLTEIIKVLWHELINYGLCVNKKTYEVVHPCLVFCNHDWPSVQDT
jgi:hypothetical protein